MAQEQGLQGQGNDLRDPTPLVAPLSAFDRTQLALAGGKGANLGELIRAGFPVPGGFCMITTAYALVSAGAQLEPLLAELAQRQDAPEEQLVELALAVHAAVLHAPIPSALSAAITGAYQELSDGDALPVAVRSSATARRPILAGRHSSLTPLAW